MFKMPHRANININKQNGTKPNQQNRKYLLSPCEKGKPQLRFEDSGRLVSYSYEI